MEISIKINHQVRDEYGTEKSITLYCDETMKGTVGIRPRVSRHGKHDGTNIVFEFDRLIDFIAGIDDKGLGLFDENGDLNPGKIFELYPNNPAKMLTFQRQNAFLIIEIQTPDLRFHELFKVSYLEFEIAVLTILQFKDNNGEYLKFEPGTGDPAAKLGIITDLKKPLQGFIRGGKKKRPYGTYGTGPGKIGGE